MPKKLQVATYSSRLADFFPEAHPNAKWVWRLAVLHDDASFERRNLGWQDSADPMEETWRMNYWSRRSGSTISEAKNVLVMEVRRWLKQNEQDLPTDEVKDMRHRIDEVEAFVNNHVGRVRNIVGIHVRESAWPRYSYEEQVTLKVGGQVGSNDFRGATWAALGAAIVEESSDVPHGDQLKQYLQSQRDALENVWIISGALVHWFLAVEAKALTPEQRVKNAGPGV